MPHSVTTGSSTTTDLHTAQRVQNLHEDSSYFDPLINHKQPRKTSKNFVCIKTVTAKSGVLSTVIMREQHSPNILLSNLEKKVLVQPSAAVLDNKTTSVSIEITNVSFWTQGLLDSKASKTPTTAYTTTNKKQAQDLHQTPYSLETDDQMFMALCLFLLPPPPTASVSKVNRIFLECAQS